MRATKTTQPNPAARLHGEAAGASNHSLRAAVHQGSHSRNDPSFPQSFLRVLLALLLTVELWTKGQVNAATQPRFEVSSRSNLWHQGQGPNQRLKSLSLVGNRNQAQLGEGLAWLPPKSALQPGSLLVGAARGGDLPEAGLVLALQSTDTEPRRLEESFRWNGPAQSAGWGRLLVTSPPQSPAQTILIGYPSAGRVAGRFALWRQSRTSQNSSLWQEVAGPLVPANDILLSAALPGDMDGDGMEDLVLALAPRATNGPQPITLRLFPGKAEGFNTHPSSTLQLGELTGPNPVVLQPTQDVDGDEVNDLLVGLPGLATTTHVHGALLVVGATPTLRVLGSPLSLPNASGFGRSICRSSDLNGDGHRELIVGAPGDEQHPGKIAVFQGHKTGWNPTPYAILQGDYPRDGAGTTLAVLEGPQWKAIAVGTPGSTQRTSTNQAEGTVRVIPVEGLRSGLMSDQARITLRGGRSSSHLGFTMLAPGDLDGDGAPELILSLPTIGFHENKAGRLEVISCPTALPAHPCTYALTFNEDPVVAKINALDRHHTSALAATNAAWQKVATNAVHQAETKSVKRLQVVIGAGAALGSLSFLGVWVARRRWERRSRELERARLARDLHDHLGAQLAQIQLWTGLAQTSTSDSKHLLTHLERISTFAKGAADSLSELVWVVNPDHDTLEGFVSYLADFTIEFLRPTRVDPSFEFVQPLPSVSLPMETRKHLLLSVKEALNNVVRHAEATRVIIRLRVEKERAFLQIEDNGRGCHMTSTLTPCQDPKGGNGLRNMASRLAELGGSCSIESASGTGTVVLLDFPLPKHGRSTRFGARKRVQNTV